MLFNYPDLKKSWWKNKNTPQRKTTLKWNVNGELSSIDMARVLEALSVKELSECELACNTEPKIKSRYVVVNRFYFQLLINSGWKIGKTFNLQNYGTILYSYIHLKTIYSNKCIAMNIYISCFLFVFSITLLTLDLFELTN